MQNIRIILGNVKSRILLLNNYLLDNDVYSNILWQFANIILTGVLIWIAIIPIIGIQPIGYVPCFGMIPFLALNFIEEYMKLKRTQ